MSILVNDIDLAIYNVTDNTTPEDHILKLEAREKKREHQCSLCKSRRLKTLDLIPNTRRCMYNGQPAECITYRTYYECKACGEKVFGDAHYFDTHVSRSFTAAFIIYAIELWLSDMNTSFREIRKRLEISYALMEEWQVDLYRTFAKKTKISSTYAFLLYAFNRPQYERRGVVVTKESKDGAPRIASFIENYTLDDVIALAKTLRKEDRSKVQLVYYSYIAGFGEDISSICEKPVCVAVNIDMLHDELVALLPKDLKKDVACKLIDAIEIVYTLENEPVDANRIVEEFNAVIDQLIQIDADNTPRADLLNQYRIGREELPYFVDTDTVKDIGGNVFENPISDEIQDMIMNSQSFYAIALKILYDNKAFKEKVIEALNELAEEKKKAYAHKREKIDWKKGIGPALFAFLDKHKEMTIAEKLDIFGLPDIEGFSVPLK